ncbi:hypothetical protein EV426DRAFT_711644 [Tirmania nivea]|nr:hypothetical protein EV426DRAFT_711644 [Tirmania nivea]
MQTKTVVVHLPLKSTGNSKLSSPRGFTSNNLKPSITTTITTMSIPAPIPIPKSASTSIRANTTEAVDQRRSTILRRRSDRRVKALSVGHISPNPSPMHATPGLDFGYDGSNIRSEIYDERRGINERHFGSTGLQPIPAAGNAPLKQSYMARVANGLGFMSKVSEEKNQKEKEPSGSNLQIKALGLGLGAGILFGASSLPGAGTGEGGSARRSRSKSNSRPGTAGGLITTASISTSTAGSTNIKPKVPDMDKPLPSCPVSPSINRRYSLRADGGAQTPFGTPGSYSLLFVDHEFESLTHPPRPNSAANFINGRPRSISTSAGGTPATTRPPSVVNAGVTMKLEPIIPVHVLDQMVSTSPQEMSPGATQRYFPPSTPKQGHSAAAGGILQRRESSRSSKSHRLGGMGSGEDFARSITPVQDAEMVIRARSLSRSNSTTVRVGTSYSRQPSKSSSLRREMGAESPPNVGESIRSYSTSRPGTSGSMYTASVSRSNSTISTRQMAIESEEVEEKERRGRGRSPGGREAVRRFNLGLEDSLSQIIENGPGDQHVRGQGKEGLKAAGDMREGTKNVTTLARKPVPVPTRPGPRNPSRPSSRSRSRSKSSRPTSPESSALGTTMNTINEVQTARAPVAAVPVRPRIIDLDRDGKSRTPSPLRPTTGAYTSGSNSSLRARYRADEGRPPAPLTSNVMRSPILPGVPKRKPVPQGPSPTAPRPQSTLPAPQPQLLRPKNPMIVAIPPSLGSMHAESPISCGGKSTAGLMSSEDEEDPMKTPMTATFSFVTPLLPSPPKRAAPQTAVSSPLAESIQSETGMVACEPQMVGNEKPLEVDVSNRILQNVNARMAFPPTPPKSSFTPPIGGMHMQTGSPSPFSSQVSTSAASSPISPLDPQTPQSSLSPAIQVQVHEAPADNINIPIDITCTPTPSTAHNSRFSTPTRVSPVSPVSPASPISLLYPPPTISNSATQPHPSSAHIIELQRQELLLERTRWESERHSLQSTLTSLSQENQKLKDLVFKLTETVERQDMELRKQQQQQQQRARGISKSLPLGATGAARGSLPQGWSVFTNPRTPPPPKPKTRTESSESVVSQLLTLENKEIPIHPGYGEGGPRRESVPMSDGSSLLSSPPPAPLGLKKGFSHSLPLLNAGTSIQKGAQVAQGLKESPAMGGAKEIRREIPMKKGPQVQGEAKKEMGMGLDATVAAVRSPKARALWKRTTAVVAVGRKAQGKWGKV